MTRYFFSLFLSLLTIIIPGCSDSPESQQRPEGSLEYGDDGKISIFHLSAGSIPSDDDGNKVEFLLTDAAAGTNLKFDGSVIVRLSDIMPGSEYAATCRMILGDLNIPDGNYFVTITGNGISHLGTRLVRFKNSVGTEADYVPMKYVGLEGEGTSESPYLINDAADFMTLLYYLGEDEYHGYGMYFRQMESFDVPRRSEIIDGKVWTVTNFQGNYDGGGHELRNLTYMGASDTMADSGIGLFKGIFNASISNVKLTNALINNVSSNVGILAGFAEGNNTIKNVSLSGTVIAGSDNTGGLIGHARGDLDITDLTLTNLTVTGQYATGGILGCFDGDRLTIDGTSTPNHIFSVSGISNVGGAVGEVETNGEVRLSYIDLTHSVDSESSSVKVISGSGDNIGGIAGSLSCGDGSAITSCTVKCPVAGADNIGSLIGRCRQRGKLTLEKNLLASVANGNENVGGFFGFLDLTTGSGKVDFGGNANGNRYVVKQSAEAHVSGSANVGALAGCIRTTGAPLTLSSPVEIAVNVSGGDNTGGAIGLLENIDNNGVCAPLAISNLNFSSTTMRVTGTGIATGGVIGKGTGYALTGSNDFDFLKTIPGKDDFQSVFNGVVKGGIDDFAFAYTGGIVGDFQGNIDGVGCGALVSNITPAGASICYFGGIAGNFNGSIRNCAFRGSVKTDGSGGGLIGNSYPSLLVEDCINFGEMDNKSCNAGIAGWVSTGSKASAEIRRCINKGTVTHGTVVGGIIGAISSPDDKKSGYPDIIEMCANYGAITGSGHEGSGVGGIVGSFMSKYAYVQYCSNLGDVTSTNVQLAVGGVIGEIGHYDGNHTVVKECLNSGEITCDNKPTKIGGIVGHLHSGYTSFNATLKDCCNTGSIPGDQKSDTGGILGMATTYSDTFRTFNRGKVAHGNAIIGTHKGGTIFSHSHNYYLEGTGGSWPSSTSVKASEIDNKSKYKDFDFNNVWAMGPDGPYLRNCPFH